MKKQKEVYFETAYLEAYSGITKGIGNIQSGLEKMDELLSGSIFTEEMIGITKKVEKRLIRELDKRFLDWFSKEQLKLFKE